MMHLRRLVKRPCHQLLLLAWIIIVCTWIFVGLHSTSTGYNIGKLGNMETKFARWTRFDKQTSLSSHQISSEDEDTTHPRLQSRPLPTHASQAEFPNVPTTFRLPADDGSHINNDEIREYITNIWDVEDTTFWRTECDGQEKLPKRYEFLKTLAENHHTSEIKYFFALDLYQVRRLLPRLMGTLVQVIKMLGPHKCAISVVEGRSQDGTYAILSALKEKVEEIGTRFYLEQSDINPHAKGVDRIGALAALRNQALNPLIKESKSTTGPPTYNHDTIITFINDIAVCTDDIYELLFQHIYQSAHQTCAMDYVNGGDLFYDSWVSRSMSGDLFFEVPQDVSFAFSENLFWDHTPSRRKYRARQPFQVYSCWGGMTTLSSAPFINGQVTIRNSTHEECYAGEPTNLAKDLWKLGYGKILTVPTVAVGYSSPETSRIKKRRGWVRDHVRTNMTEEAWQGTEKVEWKIKPPGQVKCMPGWGVASWTDP